MDTDIKARQEVRKLYSKSKILPIQKEYKVKKLGNI